MITIQQIRVADCDRSTDENGNFTSPAYQYVVCDDNDINEAYEYFDTLTDAEKALNEQY
jgi:hypothetical protein